ncbi:hypothetical protein DCC81_20480 [Chitinophaga parva]|uniref:Uncharacterized protein n=1 Tax=Chitinophaga parva TaxID=2169414 RepID=A0A2T7BCH9_9BACT|nr:hypothetical protein DCC81_20480 [Chitinophaga parva]
MGTNAQTPVPFGGVSTSPLSFGRYNHAIDTNGLRSKWSLVKYASISTGFVAFRGGSGSFLSAPLGLQLNRQLTEHLTAFGGISITPSYFYGNNAFYQPGFKNGSFGGSYMNRGSFGTYPAAQVGVMYTNDQHTFSISGSVSVSRNTYGGFAPF